MPIYVWNDDAGEYEEWTYEELMSIFKDEEEEGEEEECQAYLNSLVAL